MLVDRVLAKKASCEKCARPVSAKGLCLPHYGAARYQQNRDVMLSRETARSKERYWRDPVAGRLLSREKQRRRRALDPRLSARESMAWRDSNRPHAREISRHNMRLYRERHPDRAKASSDQWQRTHPDELRAMRHRYHLRHYARNLQYYFDKAARRRAMKRAATVEAVDFAAILIRDAGRCGICGAPVHPRELHFDHVVPLARGGAHCEANLQVAHARCNIRKGAKCS